MISKKQKVFIDAKDYISAEYNNKFRNYIPLSFKNYIDIVFSIAICGGFQDSINSIVETQSGIAAYDINNGILYYSYNGVLKEANKLASIFQDKSFTESFPELSTLTRNELINNTIISSILHELTHIMQLNNEANNETDYTLGQIYSKASGKCDLIHYIIYSSLYRKYYELLPFEREALVNQLYSHIITNPNLDNRFYLMRSFLLENTCSRGYERDYPFKRINKVFKPEYDQEELLSEIDKMDTLTKMTYGFPITEEERSVKDNNQSELIYRLSNSFYQ